MEFDNKRVLELILIIIRCRLSPLNYDSVDELNQPLTFNHQQNFKIMKHHAIIAVLNMAP